MSYDPPTFPFRKRTTMEKPPPHLRLIDELKHLRQCYEEVHRIQDRLFELSTTLKLNTTEWTSSQSEARLAVIRTRRIRTVAMKTYRAVHERLRTGLYTDDAQRTEVVELVKKAQDLFDLLHRENF